MAEWSLTETPSFPFVCTRPATAASCPRTLWKRSDPRDVRRVQATTLRWVYGPVQTFKHHWRTHLPGRGSAANALSAFRKLLYLTRGSRS